MSCFSIFDMIVEAILCVQHFSSFGEMLLVVNLLIKADSIVICIPLMHEQSVMSRFL